MPKHFGMLVIGALLVLAGIGGGVAQLVLLRLPMSLLGLLWIACGLLSLWSVYGLWRSTHAR